MDIYQKSKIKNKSNSEAPYLFRYFLRFPSQLQVVDEILPAIEKLESTNDKSKDLLELEAFEKHLISVLKENSYPAYDKEMLLEAFKVLDIEKNGYLDLQTFYTFLKSYGVSFTKTQINDMEKFLVENENELLEPLGLVEGEYAKKKHIPLITTRKFYYEAYVRQVLSDDERHFNMLMDDYQKFIDVYKETKEFPQVDGAPHIDSIAVKPPEENKKRKGKGKGKGKKK